ncbi:MAG: hypothetical protein ACOCW1_02545 [Chitinispirillaceae bacterium]
MFFSHRLPVLVLSISAAAMIIAGCGSSKSGDKTSSEADTQKPIQEVAEETPKSQAEEIVCIWDQAAIRDTCSSKGKYIAGISLGEVVKFLGETGIDPSNSKREYLKVELSDGKSGWANAYCLARNARAAAVKDPAVIFKRPDVLTMTNEKFEPMDFVAVGEEKDEFVEVIGEKRNKKGWVKKEFLVETKEDVAMAVFISKKLAESNDLSEAEKLKQIIEMAPYPNSTFLTQIKTELAELESNPEAPAVVPASMPAESATEIDQEVEETETEEEE